MLEWGGFPGNTGTLVEFVELPGKAGMSLEGLVRHTDGLLEDLLAFYA